MLVDRFFYINLDRRGDRNIHFLAECEKATIPTDKIERFKAIDGLTATIPEEDMRLFDHADYRNMPFFRNIVGNQLSHFSIMKQMLEDEDLQTIAVFQDDVVFSDGFMESLSRLEVPEDAEMVSIGFHKFACFAHFEGWHLRSSEDTDDDFEELGQERVNASVCRLKDTVNPCSLAYLLTRKGAENMIAHFREHGFRRATDWCFNDYLRSRNIFYGSSKVLCTGNPAFGSDIF